MRTLTDKLKFEYLLDSAVLIEIGGVKALIDGLPSDKNSFDLLPEALEEEIMAGQGEFRGLDCLFFTHCHGDHLSGKKLTAYLERNPKTFVAIPEDAELDFDRFRRGGAEFLIPQGEVAEVHGGRTASGLEFQYMRTGHLTFHCPEHYAYNFLEGDTSVIFTGDMDLVKLKMLKGFDKREHAFIFINNVLLWHKRWCDMIDEMGFEGVFIYHVPSEGRDQEGYREKALKCWPENGQHRPNWEIFNL